MTAAFVFRPKYPVTTASGYTPSLTSNSCNALTSPPRSPRCKFLLNFSSLLTTAGTCTVLGEETAGAYTGVEEEVGDGAAEGKVVLVTEELARLGELLGEALEVETPVLFDGAAVPAVTETAT